MADNNFCDCGQTPHGPMCGALVWANGSSPMPANGTLPVKMKVVIGGQEVEMEYFVTGPGQFDYSYPKPSACDCGAEKCRTTHAHWCSTRKGE